jgi:hypothetical protein
MKNKLFWFIAFGSWLILGAIFFYTIISGNIPFWYDPARDMLSAWDNLHKLTLIGSTSGIPGIFYGPYWIWFLSIPVFFSKDPRFATLVTSFVPYMFFLPLVLSLFRKYFNKYILLTLWILFILGAKSYVLFIWNPNNSPLLFLLATYLILSAVGKEKFFSCLKQIFLAGIVSGLALNINIAFGAVFGLSSVLFLLLNISFLLKKTLKTKIRQFFLQLCAFLIGVALMFLPFFIFEIRHGFEQTKTALTALVHGGGGLVTVSGLTKPQIIESFFARWAQLLQTPSNLGLVILVVLLAVIVILLLKKKVNFSLSERGMLLFLFSLTIGCLGLFLLVHNPVWDYHFTGIEILWVLLLGVFLTKIPLLRYVVYGWIIFLLVAQIMGFWGMLHAPVLGASSLMAKEAIVKTIANNANRKTYSVYAYSPSIYVYEYTYLFRWLANKDVPYDPSAVKREGSVYLILPSGKQSALDDFVNYRTPYKLYKTTAIWHNIDGVVIVKREQLKKIT